MKSKKLVFLIAAVLLACLIFSACGESSGGGVSDIDVDDIARAARLDGEPDPQNPDPEPEEITDNIPELDFGGYEFKILNTIQDDLHYMNLLMEPYVYEDTGDIINDAAYRRSIEIQERFNCKITEIAVSHGSRGASFRRAAQAGDNSYDIACIEYGEALSAASGGLIYDINELTYIDLDAPWWDRNAKESLSMSNKIWFCPGAYELSNFDMTRILLFNKQMVQDYGISDDVYNLVNTGAWTFEKFFGMAKQVSNDLNGDGRFDFNDVFGAGSTADHVVFGAFMNGAGEISIGKDSNDLPYFTTNTERFNRAFQLMTDNFNDGDFYFAPKNVPAAEDWCTNMFNEDRLLFYIITFNRIPKFRDMDADFGILPAPKLDESQERYYCESGSGMVAVIPQTASNPDNNGAFLEAYAYYGYKYVVPQYKEISLKTKMARDDESAAMVDIIDVSRVYDLGRLYWGSNARDPYVSQFGSGRAEVASITERNADRVAASIEKTLGELFD
ncbi:MAG: extracellular solute-binding protein [Oscillospiraceae bacterium]|nr:extracellular solute-binding protein [Oscillospiraceae bacterium]